MLGRGGSQTHSPGTLGVCVASSWEARRGLLGLRSAKIQEAWLEALLMCSLLRPLAWHSAWHRVGLNKYQLNA